jgi:hypothetical protein
MRGEQDELKHARADLRHQLAQCLGAVRVQGLNEGRVEVFL